MVKEMPATFATTDGQSFEDKEAAERHQDLLDALEAFCAAEARLNRELMENATTADGYPFSFEPWRYYRIWQDWPGLPKLDEIGTMTMLSEARSCEARVRKEAEEVVLVYYSQRGSERFSFQRHEIEVSSLYRKKENALRALAKMQKEWLAGVAKEVAETEARAGKS